MANTITMLLKPLGDNMCLEDRGIAILEYCTYWERNVSPDECDH